MINGLALSILLFAFFASVSFNGFFSSIAKKNNFLIDIPDKSRKFHFRATPLTGGLGIFFGILISGILISGLTDANYSLDFSKKGFLDNSQLQERPVSRNFAVDDKNYELSLNKTSVSTAPSFGNGHTNISLVPLVTCQFVRITPELSTKKPAPRLSFPSVGLYKKTTLFA